MAKPYTITITQGTGSMEIPTGEYNVEASVAGYDNVSLTPSTVTVNEEGLAYEFTLSANGTLTLHVTDSGTEDGEPIVGATFIRCDAEGTEYGSVVTSDDSGNAVFEHVPFAESDGPTIYYKQKSSDGEHDYDAELQETTMTEEAVTLEIFNAPPTLQEFKVTDANYEGLPIDGEITLS